MQPRPPISERLRTGQRLVLDGLGALAYAAAAWLVFGHKVTPWPLAAGEIVLVVVALVAGRHRPLLAFAAALGGFWLGALAASLSFVALVPLAYVLYRIAARLPLWVSAIVLASALTGPLAPLVADTGHRGGVFPFSVAIVLAWTIGYATGEQRRYAADLVRHHAGLAEVERERARRGVTEERLRIARELHDVVAHSMSVITVQAGYGHLIIDENPGEARSALAAIEATGRQTLDEMRRLLDVLRADADLTPAPRLSDLDALVAQTAAAGVRVELTVTGQRRDLPAGVDLSAYRIVQEALTNVVKHAGTPTARALVAYLPDALTIEVIDAGRGGPIRVGGFGLAGMRERARLYGGQVSVAPLPGRGFRVHARLPLPAGEAA
jgi:signal transduction histidine kinase